MEQLELELSSYRVIKAIKESKDKRNRKARKTFFDFVKFNMWRKNVNRRS